MLSFLVVVIGKLWEDMIKMSMAKSHMSNLMDEASEKFQKDRTCDVCGRNFDRAKGGKCMKGGFGCDNENLCSKCMKVCRDCKKVFCPKHISKHKCK